MTSFAIVLISYVVCVCVRNCNHNAIGEKNCQGWDIAVDISQPSQFLNIRIGFGFHNKLTFEHVLEIQHKNRKCL